MGALNYIFQRKSRTNINIVMSSSVGKHLNWKIWPQCLKVYYPIIIQNQNSQNLNFIRIFKTGLDICLCKVEKQSKLYYQANRKIS